MPDRGIGWPRSPRSRWTPWRGYASALVAPLSHARVVVDHFHAIRLATPVVDQVRRRTQQATLGHRGRKRDPLYRIRKLLLTAQEQLTGIRIEILLHKILDMREI